MIASKYQACGYCIKVLFHHHVTYISSHAFKLLDVIRAVTFFFSPLYSLLLLCFTLVMSELQYASAGWST